MSVHLLGGKTTNKTITRRPVVHSMSTETMADEITMKGKEEIDVKKIAETTSNVEETQVSPTAHPAIADGSVDSTNPLRKFMQRTKEKFDAVPQGWGQMRTNSGSQSVSSGAKDSV